jgi:hypothetical protein
MLARSLGQLRPAQHARHFFRALLAGHRANRGPCAPARFFLLLDHIMMIPKGRDLRQMRHAQHLIRSATATSTSSPPPPPPVPQSRYQSRQTPKSVAHWVPHPCRVLCDRSGGFDFLSLFIPGEVFPASTLALSASITRDNSPPEAMCSSCRSGSPGLVEIIYTTRSMPDPSNPFLPPNSSSRSGTPTSSPDR